MGWRGGLARLGRAANNQLTLGFAKAVVYTGTEHMCRNRIVQWAIYRVGICGKCVMYASELDCL